MAVNGRWKLVAAFLSATLAIAGCGDDSTGNGDGDNNNGGNTNGNGTGTNGNGTNGNGELDGGGLTTDLDDNVAGDACNSASDCKGTGTQCASEIGGIGGFGGREAPGGYCTGECDSDAQCGAGGICIGAIAGLANGRCHAACKADSDCRDGYECSGGIMLDADAGGQIPGGGGVTIPDSCLPKPETVTIADGKVGQACTADADCGGGVCSTRLGLGTQAPGGYCSGPCTANEDCGAGGVCSGQNPLTGAGTCYLGCEAASDCTRAGYTCRTPGLFGGDIEVCYPGTANPDGGA